MNDKIKEGSASSFTLHPSSFIKVLIVDDSGFMRASLAHILSSDKEIEVVGIAEDGEDGIKKAKQLKPDVVLLDIEMPRMDGLTALAHIMAESPTPVVVLSGLGEKDSRIAIRCLEHGAIDFIHKPSGVISYDIEKLKDEIISKVRIAADVDVKKMSLELPKVSYVRGGERAERRKEVVIIGASTGGPRALEIVLGGLRRDLSSAVIVVQHMKRDFIPAFAERLKWGCSLDVSVAGDGEVIREGRIYISPGECNTAIEKRGEDKIIAIRCEENSDTLLPSIDYTMKSAVDAYGGSVVGVLLTGIGSDGVEGLMAIKDAGGATIAEDESTCVVFGMPKAAIEAGCVDEILPLHQIAAAIMRKV